MSTRIAAAIVIGFALTVVANASEENQGGYDRHLETAARGIRKSGGINAHDTASIRKLIDDINTAVRSNKQRMLSIIVINTDIASSQLEREKSDTGMTFGDVYVAHSLSMATRKKFKDIVSLHKSGQTWAQIAKSHNVSLKGSSELIKEMQRQQ